MEELPRSSPKATAISAPVFVPAQSLTVSAAPSTVTVSASPFTVPVSAIVSVTLVTVIEPAPATVTASSAMVTASVPPTVTVPVPTSYSGIVPTSQVSVTPSTASSVHDFPMFSGDQDKKKNLTSFEKEHFCPKNVMPERLCYAYFRTSEDLKFQDVLSAITNSGVAAEDVRCIQYKHFFFSICKRSSSHLFFTFFLFSFCKFTSLAVN